MIKRIKKKLDSIITNYKELKCLNKHLHGKKGIYNFSKNDLSLYKIEKKIKLPRKKSIKVNERLTTVSISDRNIFWPKSVSDRDLPWLSHEIFDDFDKNPSSYNHSQMEYSNANWIIDAGCCEGYFSLFAFEKNLKCQLIALEPLEEMKESLLRTFESQIKRDKFFLEQKALGKEPGMMKFMFDSAHLCDSSFSDSEKIDNLEKNTFYDVSVVSLDALMRQYKLDVDGIIKMDIEGAEMDALLGGKELMQKYKPKLAIAVYHEYENAMKCREIILEANPEYKVEFRGMYGYFSPPRPYILFAW